MYLQTPQLAGNCGKKRDIEVYINNSLKNPISTRIKVTVYSPCRHCVTGILQQKYFMTSYYGINVFHVVHDVRVKIAF